jgi:glucokinase
MAAARDRAAYVVISGLPASGKTMLGREISRRLGLPLLDKDDFLEGLFARDGTGDAGHRNRLSRESDAMLRAATEASGGAVLVSFWRHPGGSGGGTASEWLLASGATLVEIHCRCPAEGAAERFANRCRHPGHLDELRSPEMLARQFEDYARLGPLRIGCTIEVDTSGPLKPGQLRSLAASIRRAMTTGSGQSRES